MNQMKQSLMQHMPHFALRGLLRLMELRHHRIVRRIRGDLGLRPAELNVEGLRQSDAVFLLGSGPSINDISERRWKEISTCDTMGLNFWIRHPFVPTFFFFEAAPARLFDQLRELAWRREDDYRGVLKIATSHINHSPFLERQFAELPQSWLDDMVPLETATTFARNDRELRLELSRFLSQGLFAQDGPVLRLFKYMGTMTSLISLSAKMGYQDIVLCGVDLSNSGYFYQDPMRYPDMAGFASSPKLDRHVLMADELAHCGADQVITAIADLVLKPRGISLFVENASSALYPGIPLAPDRLLSTA